MDLGQDKMVSGVLIQGGKHRDRNVFMKRFRVGHSLDGEDWTVVKEDNTTKTKVGLTRFQKSAEFQSDSEQKQARLNEEPFKICFQALIPFKGIVHRKKRQKIVASDGVYF